MYEGITSNFNINIYKEKTRLDFAQSLKYFKRTREKTFEKYCN